MVFKRLTAALIDYIILWIIIVVFIGIAYLFKNLLSDELVEILGFIFFYFIALFILVYIGLKDLLFQTQSIGKKVMEIKVVSNDNKKITRNQLILRNLIWVKF